MKKIILKIILSIFLFFGLSNLSFADISVGIKDNKVQSLNNGTYEILNNSKLYNFNQNGNYSVYKKDNSSYGNLYLYDELSNTELVIDTYGYRYSAYIIGDYVYYMKTRNKIIKYEISTGNKTIINFVQSDIYDIVYSYSSSRFFVVGSSYMIYEMDLSNNSFSYVGKGGAGYIELYGDEAINIHKNNNCYHLLDNTIKKCVDITDNLIYYTGLEYFSNILENSGTPNQICESIIKEVNVKFDYNYKPEYTTYIDYLHDNREEGLFEYGAGGNKFYVSIENVEDLYGFSGSLINGGASSIVFNSLDSPLADPPTLTLKSNLSFVNYFKLDSVSNSNVRKFVGVDFNDNIIYLNNYDSDGNNFNFNELYYFNRTDLKGFQFIFDDTSFSENLDLKIDFGKIIKENKVYEVCYDEGTNENITVDDESYSGSLDNIGDLDIAELSEIPLSSGNGVIDTFIYDFLDTYNLSSYFDYINFTLPIDPNLTIIFPVLKINTNLQFGIEAKEVELIPIEDTIGMQIDENSTIGIKFISIILAFLYILFRLLILYILFSVFRFFYRSLFYISTTLFGTVILNKGSGSLVSLTAFIAYQTAVFVLFITLFSYILQLDYLFTSVIEFGTVMFNLLIVSFGDYELFKNVVLTFVVGLFTTLIAYIIFLFTSKYV